MGIIFLMGLLHMQQIKPMAQYHLSPYAHFAGKTLISAGIISLAALPFFAVTIMREPFSMLPVINIIGFSLLGGLGNTLFFSWLNKRSQMYSKNHPKAMSILTKAESEAKIVPVSHPASSHQQSENEDDEEVCLTKKAWINAFDQLKRFIIETISKKFTSVEIDFEKSKRAWDERLEKFYNVIATINTKLPKGQQLQNLASI